MAKLTSGHLELEIGYRAFEHGWVVYNIGYRWDGKPILNDAVLKRHNEYWNGRGIGEVHANEHQLCCFIPMLDELLRENKPVHVTTTDPDVTLAIWPHDAFPFQPSHWKVIGMSEEFEKEQEAREAAREAAGGILPDDDVELMLFVDVYNFYESSYSDEGVVFRMRPSWKALGSFYDELRFEFAAFARANRILEYIVESSGEEDYLAWWREWMDRPAH